MKKNTEIPFNKSEGNISVAKRLLVLDQQQRHAVLATDNNGQPYTSLVAFALTGDGRGVLFATPKKTSKYKNILGNNKVSLLIDTRSNSAKGYMQSEAVTICGTASLLRKSRRRDELLKLFIKKHPVLAEFACSSTTALICVTIESAIHAGRFQVISEWEG